MFLGVWYNLGVSDCPVAWDLQRSPLGRFSPPWLEPLGSCGIGGEGRTCLVPLFFLLLAHPPTTLSTDSRCSQHGPV